MSDLSFASAALSGLSSFQRQLYRGPEAIQNHAEFPESVMESLMVPRTSLGREHTDGKYPFNLRFSFATQSVLRIDIPEIRVSDFYKNASAPKDGSPGRSKVEVRLVPYIGNRVVRSYSLFLGQNKKATSTYNGHLFNHLLLRGQVENIEEKLETLGHDSKLTEWTQHIPASTLCVFVPSVYSCNPGSHLPLMHFRDSPDRPYEQFVFERELGKLIQVRVTKIVERDGTMVEEVFEIPLDSCSIKRHPLFTNPKLEAQWKIPIPDWIVFYSQLTADQELWHSHRHRDPRWNPNFYYKDLLFQSSKNPVAMGATENFSLRPNYPTTSVHWICQNTTSTETGDVFDYLTENDQNPSQSYQLLRDKDIIFEGDQTMSNQIMPLMMGWNGSAQSAPSLKSLRRSCNSHYFSKEVPHGDCQFGIQVANLELSIRLGSTKASPIPASDVQEDDIVITNAPTSAPEESEETFRVMFFQEVIRSWTWKVVNDKIHGCVVAQEHAD